MPPKKLTMGEVVGLCWPTTPRCPTCGSPMEPVSTRLVLAGGQVWVARRRRCVGCHTTVNTVQRPARQIAPEDLEEAAAQTIPEVASPGWGRLRSAKMFSRTVARALREEGGNR